MAKSKQTELPKNVATQIIERFFQVIGDMRNEHESRIFLTDFLTDSERLTFAKRLAIALELEQKKSYEDIKKLYGVSSATISSVSEMMKSEGLQLALKKVQIEDWSDGMAETFIHLFKR